MELDRQVIFVICVAIGAMVGFSGFFFAPAAPARAPHERPAYAPEDIRSKYQQADAKKPKRKQAESSVPEFTTTETPTPNKTVSAGGSDRPGDNGNDDDKELSEQDPQEEPEIE